MDLKNLYKIPIAILFVNNLTAGQVEDLTVHVMNKVEKCGFSIEGLVSDCLCVNVKIFTNPNGGVLHPVQKVANNEATI